MSLQKLHLPLEPIPPPDVVIHLIKTASRFQDEFYNAGLGLSYPKYVPSDPLVVYSAIQHLYDHGDLQGNVFCEWGCGFAIASGIASLVGMEAYGIEIEDELLERATRLMGHLGLPVEILQVDYLPYGFDEAEEIGGKQLIRPEFTTSRGSEIPLPAYEGLDPGEVDLFFVYPWPDQEEMMQDLFEAVSIEGSVLLMYQGEGEISAFLHD